MTKHKGFWSRFGDLMDSLPDYIDEEINNSTSVIQSGGNSVTTVGKNNRVFSSSSSKSVTVTNGLKIVSESKNGKSRVTINGDEVVPKKFADDLLKQVEQFREGEDFSKADVNYKKYLEKRK